MVSRGVNSPGDRWRCGEEVDFAQRLVAAVEPGVEAPAMRRGRRIGWRARPGRRAARCHRSWRRSPRTTRPVAVVHGAWPAASWAARSSPCWSRFLAAAISSGLKNSLYCERVAHGLVIDEHVGQQRGAFRLALFSLSVAARRCASPASSSARSAAGTSMPAAGTGLRVVGPGPQPQTGVRQTAFSYWISLSYGFCGRGGDYSI